MAERSELETIIGINMADLDEGFWVVETSIESHYRKLVERVGSANIISVRVDTCSQSKKPVGWEVKLKKECLAKGLFPTKGKNKKGNLENLRKAA
jgi:hypothetical protein